MIWYMKWNMEDWYNGMCRLFRQCNLRKEERDTYWQNSNFIFYRGCTKYITILDDLRLSIDRGSKYFKSNYSLCTECERYHSRLKNTRQEQMWVRNKAPVTNLNTLAHISLLAVAAVTTHSGQSYQSLKAVKRTA